MKHVLVIGGSLFTGRVFTIFASRNGGFDMHVINRGNHPMERERVTQYKCDRHAPQMMASLVPEIPYNALIDFCAYEPGDISTIIETLGNRINQYIYFSTASVCLPGEGFLDESAPRLDIPKSDSNEVTAYIRKKIELEDELIDACGAAGINYTILRPTFIYGPFNYAPRESYFIELIAKGLAVPVPSDSTSRFNFCYVIDIAHALMACIGNEKAYNDVFNLANDEILTYARLMSEFERCNGKPFKMIEMTVAQADEEMIPLPFPLSGDTLTNGEKFVRTFEFCYTPFSQGIEKTFEIFHDLYTPQETI